MVTDRLNIKRRLTLVWLAVAAVLLLAARAAPSETEMVEGTGAGAESGTSPAVYAMGSPVTAGDESG